MNEKLYNVCYAATMGGVCALLLTGAGEMTKDVRRANIVADAQRSTLTVLGVPFDRKVSSQELVKVYKANVKERDFKAAGLKLFVYSKGGRVSAAAVPFHGPGLWGPVKGMLALDPTLKTIQGITVLEQEETPGLGGEIGNAEYQKKFVGKPIKMPDGKPGIRIVRGKAKAAHEVDGISGATMTCKKFEAMINVVLAKIAKGGVSL